MDAVWTEDATSRATPVKGSTPLPEILAVTTEDATATGDAANNFIPVVIVDVTTEVTTLGSLWNQRGNVHGNS